MSFSKLTLDMNLVPEEADKIQLGFELMGLEVKYSNQYLLYNNGVVEFEFDQSEWALGRLLC